MSYKLIFLFLLLPCFVSGQGKPFPIIVSTNIIINTTPKTTSQLLIENYVRPAVTNNSKLLMINLLLNDADYFKSIAGIAIDTKTGQDLINYKTNIETEIRNKKSGCNYFAHITYPIYKKAVK